MSIRRALLEDLPMLAVVAAFAATTWVLSALTGYPGATNWLASYQMLGDLVILYALAAMLVAPIHAVVVEKRTLRQASTWRRMARRVFPPEKTLNFLMAVAAFGLLMPAFIAFKRSIPIVHPFSWDIAFMEWDRLVHFGRHPFELLQPFLGRPGVTWFIDRTYFLWIHVMWMTLIWQAWHGSRDTGTRSRYMLSFVLCWIVLGTVAATLLSSAGPVYYADVTGMTSPYEPLMEYLRNVGSTYDLRALWVHDFLWSAYLDEAAVAVGGISAMPSLHIAIAVLQTFLGFSINRWLGWAYAVFAFLIFLGSIHLAWHYAIDGYVSLVAVFGIWWVSGKVVTWWRAQVVGFNGVIEGSG